MPKKCSSHESSCAQNVPKNSCTQGYRGSDKSQGFNTRIFESGIEDFVRILPGVNGTYPYPLFDEIRAAPDVPREIAENLTDCAESDST
jgi:hypothetical protein